MSDTQEWPGGIAAITLFVEDLDSAKSFYQEVFELPIHYEDENSAVFTFGGTLVNLLRATEAPGLIEPRCVASRDAGLGSSSRSASMTSTLCAQELGRRGRGAVERTDEPALGRPDRVLRDPSGHIWEIAH